MLKSVLKIFAVLFFVMLGSVSAHEQGGAQPTCDDIFAKHADSKGFMSLGDFQQYWNASGHKKQVNIDNAHNREAEIAFLKASGGSFQMSKPEFCRWLKYSPEAQHSQN